MLKLATHERFPIARPWKQDTGRFLEVQNQTKFYAVFGVFYTKSGNIEPRYTERL